MVRRDQHLQKQPAEQRRTNESLVSNSVQDCKNVGAERQDAGALNCFARRQVPAGEGSAIL